MRLTKAGRVALKKVLTPDENLDERALSRVRHNNARKMRPHAVWKTASYCTQSWGSIRGRRAWVVVFPPVVRGDCPTAEVRCAKKQQGQAFWIGGSKEAAGR